MKESKRIPSIGYVQRIRRREAKNLKYFKNFNIL